MERSIWNVILTVNGEMIKWVEIIFPVGLYCWMKVLYSGDQNHGNFLSQLTSEAEYVFISDVCKDVIIVIRILEFFIHH